MKDEDEDGMGSVVCDGCDACDEDAESPPQRRYQFRPRSRQGDPSREIGASSLSLTCFASIQYLRSILASVLVFAITTPLGSVIGVIVTKESSSLQGEDDFKQTPMMQLIVGFLQALACGTFFYVTFFEILPKEINDGQEGEENKEKGVRRGYYGSRWSGWNRLLKISSILVGFVCVALMVKFIGNGCIDDDDDNDDDASVDDQIRQQGQD